MDSERDQAPKSGLMEPSTKASGEIIKPMARASSGMLMEMSMKASGKMIKPMAMVRNYIMLM
jgi:hypothetical protein